MSIILSNNNDNIRTDNSYTDNMYTNDIVTIGALKSPDDPDDYIFERIAAEFQDYHIKALPDEFNLLTYNIRDQGMRSTCAACAGATVKEMQENKDSGSWLHISSEFIYYHRSNKPSEGMYGRNVFQILQKIGSVPEDEYPYGTDRIPTDDLYDMALSYRIANYARVRTVDGLKRALINIGPGYIQLPLYSTRPHFWRKTTNEPDDKGHAVVVIGYNAEGFILLNSWGDTWNDNGCIVFPYAEWDLHWECWISVDKTFASPQIARKSKKGTDKAHKSAQDTNNTCAII